MDLPLDEFVRCIGFVDDLVAERNGEPKHKRYERRQQDRIIELMEP